MKALDDAMATLQRARPGDRAAVSSMVRGVMAEAIVERNRLDRKLSAQWDWFAANPNHPEEETKTDVFVRTLKRYADVCDAIAAATTETRRCPSA